MNWRGALYGTAVALHSSEWKRHLREIRSRPADELARDHLDALLRHATTQVPYYEGLPPAIESFPLLTRALLRANEGALHSRDVPLRQIQKTCTGGSTGEPVWLLHDRSFWQWNTATDFFYYETFLGIPWREVLSLPRVVLWHHRAGTRAPLQRIKDAFASCLRPSTFLETYAVMGEERLVDYAERISRAKPRLVLSFAGSLYEIARAARRHNLKMHRPQVIVTSVEMLYPHMRAEIEEVFDCRVYSVYGAAEVGWVAGQCRCGRYHAMSFHNRVEILDADDRPVGPGEDGRLVLTPLHEEAMPLIRYEIGDLARMGRGACDCGNPLPVIDEIKGRVIEQFLTADGRTLYGGYFVSLFYDQPWVAEFQVLQEELDLISVFVKHLPRESLRSDAMEAVNDGIRAVMGPACRIRWFEVDEVPRTPLGKHLHTRSLVWEDRHPPRSADAT
jgi:phenylacetate-CoA ligase